MGTEQSYAENEIDRLQDDIESATARLDRRYDILIRQFVELDKYIGQMKAESEYLDTIFQSITDAQSKNKK
jgi:flagellar hook-associated protein 2